MGRKKRKGGHKKRQKSMNLDQRILDYFKSNPKRSFTDRQIINKFLKHSKKSVVQQSIINLLARVEILVRLTILYLIQCL